MALFFLLTVFAIFAQEILAAPFHQGPKNTDFDYYVFAQEWPYAMCQVANVHHPGSCAVPSQINSWTIHGLWPSSLHQKEGPSNCDSSRPFKESELHDVMDQLNQQWPNVIPTTSTASFWEHEWSKHGTCAIEASEEHGELKYFKEALALNLKYSMGTYFQQAEIQPSTTTTITLNQVQQAIQKATGKTFETHCLHTNKNGQENWYLLDTRICLDKNLEPIDCPESGSHKHQQELMELREKHNGNNHEHSGQLPSPERCPDDQPLYYIPMTQ
jgi:ribonuclease T2